ncbi:MAG: FHA domain-containing protein, partial [Chloroflexi bacterium]
METPNPPVARLRWNAEELELYPGQLIRVGRASENDIVLPDPKVSRNHAELEWNGTGFILRDLSSVNGTYVNGQRLANSNRLLRDGDEVLFSVQKMTFEIVRAEAPSLPIVPSASDETEPLGSPGFYLVVSSGPDMGQQYPLWGETITIGRASREATWEIRLTDRAVSRPHAR